MSFELRGRVKVINETQQVTESFKKREFVLTDETSQYPQDISFQLSQDNTDRINGVKVGDVILVKFNLRGKEWVNPEGVSKFFNSLDAWFIQKGEAEAQPEAMPTQMANNVPSAEESDPLPF